MAKLKAIWKSHLPDRDATSTPLLVQRTTHPELLERPHCILHQVMSRTFAWRREDYKGSILLSAKTLREASRRLGCKTIFRRNSDTKKSSINYFPTTIDSHSSLCAREQVSEEPLGVVRLRRGLTQTVDEDGGATVRFQHGADESLEEDEELLVLG